jgi:hypothetical protein
MTGCAACTRARLQPTSFDAENWPPAEPAITSPPQMTSQPDIAELATL